ncbi:hypothetical protein L4D15_17035 [Enterovibrio norvegicus]|uniref:hypothetical protein n=1 Tax=Enterovibrio norvegicus TaxID=188144 RepID=UPI003D0E1E1F
MSNAALLVWSVVTFSIYRPSMRQQRKVAIHPEITVVLEGKFWRGFGESMLSKWAGISTYHPKVIILDLHMQKKMKEALEFNSGTYFYHSVR